MHTGKQSRKELRQHLLQRRRLLTESFQSAASAAISNKILSTKLFQTSQNIACYLAAKGEVDVSLVIQRIWSVGKSCFLPVLDHQKKFNLNFIRYAKEDTLVLNNLGIAEPVYDEARVIAPDQLDLVIAPLVGFDVYGNRLGQGGGCYDRSFAFKQQMELVQQAISDRCLQVDSRPDDFNYRRSSVNFIKPHLIGVAYEWQQVSALEVSPWDVPLDFIVTEENVYGINDDVTF